LTIKFGNDYYAEMEQIWGNLIDLDSNPQDIQNPQVFNENLNKNISIIIDFLLSIGVRKRNPAFVLYSKKIIVYISRTYACKNLIDILYELRIKGIIPIIAHPERYEYVQKDISYVDKLIDEGALLQSNYGSIIDVYGKHSKKTLKKLLKHNKISLMATDIHFPDNKIYQNIDKSRKRINFSYIIN